MTQTATLTKSVTYAELAALIAASELKKGASYTITDFQTVHFMIDGDAPIETDVNEGAIEPLLITAASSNSLYKEAQSVLFPQDTIYYDWNPENWSHDIAFSGWNEVITVPNFKGVIYFRHDGFTNVSMGYDFRNVKFRRWNNGTSVGDGSVWKSAYQGVYSSSDGVVNIEDYIDVLTFDTPVGIEQYNGRIRNVSLVPFTDNTIFYDGVYSILTNNVFFCGSELNNTRLRNITGGNKCPHEHI